IRGADVKDISWLGPDGKDMPEDAWGPGFVRCLGVRLAGDLIGDLDERGERIVGDTLLLLFNAHHEAIPFTLPAHKQRQHWEVLRDTPAMPKTPLFHRGGDQVVLGGRSMVVLRTQREEEVQPTTLTPAQVEKLLRERRPTPVVSGQPT